MIRKRLSDISGDKEYFDQAAPVYNEALKNCTFNETLKFLSSLPTRRHRGRNIIWFNPSFSNNVRTNVGKLFLSALQKHFPRHRKYYKLFNKNKVKISYSFMSNMKSVIQNQNANLLLKHTIPVAASLCSCRQKSESPLNNKYLSESLVYKAAVSESPSQINKYYYGTCEKNLNEWYNNNTASFRKKTNRKVRNSLSIFGN